MREEVGEGESAVCLMLPLKGFLPLHIQTHTYTRMKHIQREERKGWMNDTPGGRGILCVRCRPCARLQPRICGCLRRPQHRSSTIQRSEAQRNKNGQTAGFLSFDIRRGRERAVVGGGGGGGNTEKAISSDALECRSLHGALLIPSLSN